MSHVLMPKATAVWLIENTALTFAQVADFCGLHPLEVQSIADDEIAVGMVGFDPISNGQLTREEIDRCQTDPETRLEMAEADVPRPTTSNRVSSRGTVVAAMASAASMRATLAASIFDSMASSRP